MSGRIVHQRNVTPRRIGRCTSHSGRCEGADNLAISVDPDDSTILWAEPLAQHVIGRLLQRPAAMADEVRDLGCDGVADELFTDAGRRDTACRVVCVSACPDDWTVAHAAELLVCQSTGRRAGREIALGIECHTSDSSKVPISS